MNDTIARGIYISSGLLIFYFTLIIAFIVLTDFSDQLKIYLILWFWPPHLIYAVPVMRTLRSKNLVKTLFGFKIMVYLLLLLNLLWLLLAGYLT